MISGVNWPPPAPPEYKDHNSIPSGLRPSNILQPVSSSSESRDGKKSPSVAGENVEEHKPIGGGGAGTGGEGGRGSLSRSVSTMSEGSRDGQQGGSIKSVNGSNVKHETSDGIGSSTTNDVELMEIHVDEVSTDDKFKKPENFPSACKCIYYALSHASSILG